ncbi:MAG: SapB/AmfS family lantipeptide [Gemmatimonas sp.]|jgi:hypothetical protein|nr:SapB/AmfS family lantipeptide [Gemmatimonas sp.]
MSRILELQRMDAIGAERAGMQDAEDASTCSYLACGSSTASCIACCGGTTCTHTQSTF